MSQGVEVAGLYVRDQDEALDFYVGKLGFKLHTDARNGDYRWLTVRHPQQEGFQPLPDGSRKLASTLPKRATGSWVNSTPRPLRSW